MAKPVDNNKRNEKEEELNPLVNRGKLPKVDSDDDVSRKRTLRGLLAILAILLGVAWVVVDDKEAVQSEDSVLLKKTQKSQGLSKGACPQFCNARLQQRKKHHGGDFLKQRDLLLQLDAAKQKLVDDLKKKYGEFFDPLWMQDGDLREGFAGINGNQISTARFRRKLKMKLYEMQHAIRVENENMEGCNCNEESARRRLVPKTIVLPDLQQTYSKFVWATGGHSAAAGHGNLHNETYTAFMERAAQPLFEAVGIEFEARNYAMGGMPSAPEYALCQESIFGTDADLVTWDFGMTDVPRNWKQSLYVSRAGKHRNRPAVVAINIHGFDIDLRKDILQKVEDFGITTFYLLEEAMNSMQDALPDMLGMNQEQIDAVPEYVRYFKCKEQLEKSEPGCDANKYTPTCPNRLHKAGWHPGWKVNAMYGNLMAMHLLHNLKGAVEEIGSDEYDPHERLLALKKEEDDDYERFNNEFSVPRDEPTPEFLEGDALAAIDPNWLNFSPLICHTALAPSQLRYKGIFTETEDELGMNGYYKGISKNVADKGQADGPMRIVFDENFRDNPCDELTKIDFKDFLYTHEKDGWVNVRVPNDSEEREFGALQDPKGIVMLCFMLCDWGNCPDGDIRPEALTDGKLQIKVNGEPVTELTSAAECNIARNKDGFFFKDEDGRFNIEVFVEKSTNEHRQYTRITSIIVM